MTTRFTTSIQKIVIISIIKEKLPTDRQHGLIFAVDARAVAEITVMPFLHHLADAAVRQNVTCVNQSV